MWLTLLSLDAPTVAVLWQRLFARCFRVQLGSDVTMLLALIVWLIYVADRLLDSLKALDEGAEAVRHQFYRKHRRAFLPPLVAGFLLSGWIAMTRLDSGTFRGGMAMMLAVGLYFVLVHRRQTGQRSWLPKEMLVGLLFGVGTCFPVWERLPGWNPLGLPSGLLFIALCWMNCAAIEYSEWKRLRPNPYGSPHPWTVWLGGRFSWLAALIATVALGFLLAGFSRPSSPLFAAIALSATLFTALNLRSGRLSNDQYRVLMDLALFTPALLVPFLRL